VKPSFKYLSGQWVWLNVPAISRMQYHPFTITSAPSDGYVSLHIRCVGDWTDELAQYVGATQEVEATATSTGLALSVPVNLKINIDGPFGAPAELVYREQAVLCVGAGIGITPWASVLKDIWYTAVGEESDYRARLKNNTAQKVMLRRVELIWVCQNINQLQWFANLLATMQQEMSQIDPKCFTIHIYLTRTDRKDKVPFQLRSNTSFGRPNWNTVIGNVRAAIDAGEYMDEHPSRVGVYLCGGYRLGKEIAKTCRKYSDRKFRFRFKKEHF
jgi:NADPH oxidase